MRSGKGGRLGGDLIKLDDEEVQKPVRTFSKPSCGWGGFIGGSGSGFGSWLRLDGDMRRERNRARLVRRQLFTRRCGTFGEKALYDRRGVLCVCPQMGSASSDKGENDAASREDPSFI